MIDEQLLEVLACPICPTRPPVKLKEHYLICTECSGCYRIVDGIPRMLPEDAITQEQAEDEIG